jgi:hypothetical protein
MYLHTSDCSVLKAKSGYILYVSMHFKIWLYVMNSLSFFLIFCKQFPLQDVHWPLRVIEKMWRYDITPQVAFWLLSFMCTVYCICMYVCMYVWFI